MDWFNVCCGITEYDLLFEERCRNVIDTMGITIKRSDIMKTLNTIVGNEKYKTALKRAIKARLLKCSGDPQTFMDRILNNVSYPTFSACDFRVPGSVLYLYDEYLYLLNMKMSGVTKLELVLLLIYCETRQHLLSKYISLELLRKKKDKVGEVKDILKKIRKLDDDIVKKYEKEEQKEKESEEKEEDKKQEEEGEKKKEKEELNEMERMEYQKLMELKKEKEEEEQRKREQMPELQKMIDENNEIKERVKLELEEMETSEEVKKAREDIVDMGDIELFGLDKQEEEALNSRNQEGGEFKFNKEKIKKECSTMKTNRLIFPHQLRILYNCFDNN